QEKGFKEVAKDYLSRLPPEQGVRRDIDENGDLLIRRMGKVDVERRALLPALAVPSWLDPATGGPRGSFCAPSGSIHRTPSCSSAPPSRANGRCRAPSCSQTSIPKRLRARRAPPSAAASSAFNHSAGRRWCRSWKSARTIAAR